MGTSFLKRSDDPHDSVTRIDLEEDKSQVFLEGLLRNDRQTMAQLYDMYGGMAYGLARATLGATTDAEDVVQEAFIALWRQASRLDPSRGIKSYLMTIVHNKSIDRLRHRSRTPQSDLEEVGPLRSKDAGPEDIALQIDDRERIHEALGGLSQEQRETVELTYFRGLTTAEAAKKMQVPVGTVKSRLRLALGHLRQRLAASA
jgi:RNA polymerase sigma-70 factor (ECF subfamily)